MKGRPADYADVVRHHHRKTVAWLLAATGPCLRMREQEIERIRRDMRRLDREKLATFRPKGSWLVAVILCPRDDLDALVEWTRSLQPRDRDRIRFYAHPDTDIRRAFAPWYAAGLGDPRFTVVSGWKELHPLLGRDLNDRVCRDATAGKK